MGIDLEAAGGAGLPTEEEERRSDHHYEGSLLLPCLREGVGRMPAEGSLPIIPALGQTGAQRKKLLCRRSTWGIWRYLCFAGEDRCCLIHVATRKLRGVKWQGLAELSDGKAGGGVARGGGGGRNAGGFTHAGMIALE
jgi:hypothetical protein